MAEQTEQAAGTDVSPLRLWHVPQFEAKYPSTARVRGLLASCDNHWLYPQRRASSGSRSIPSARTCPSIIPLNSGVPTIMPRI